MYEWCVAIFSVEFRSWRCIWCASFGCIANLYRMTAHVERSGNNKLHAIHVATGKRMHNVQQCHRSSLSKRELNYCFRWTGEVRSQRPCAACAQRPAALIINNKLKIENRSIISLSLYYRIVFILFLTISIFHIVISTHSFGWRQRIQTCRTLIKDNTFVSLHLVHFASIFDHFIQ